MPYISPDRRALFDGPIEKICDNILTTGELNYVVSKLMREFVKLFHTKQTYADLSRTRGAVQDAVDEFYRRVMVPYEDRKIEENGDLE